MIGFPCCSASIATPEPSTIVAAVPATRPGCAPHRQTRRSGGHVSPRCRPSRTNRAAGTLADQGDIAAGRESLKQAERAPSRSTRSCHLGRMKRSRTRFSVPGGQAGSGQMRPVNRHPCRRVTETSPRLHDVRRSPDIPYHQLAVELGGDDVHAEAVGTARGFHPEVPKLSLTLQGRIRVQDGEHAVWQTEDREAGLLRSQRSVVRNGGSSRADRASQPSHSRARFPSRRSRRRCSARGETAQGATAATRVGPPGALAWMPGRPDADHGELTVSREKPNPVVVLIRERIGEDDEHAVAALEARPDDRRQVIDARVRAQEEQERAQAGRRRSVYGIAMLHGRDPVWWISSERGIRCRPWRTRRQNERGGAHGGLQDGSRDGPR